MDKSGIGNKMPKGARKMKPSDNLGMPAGQPKLSVNLINGYKDMAIVPAYGVRCMARVWRDRDGNWLWFCFRYARQWKVYPSPSDSKYADPACVVCGCDWNAVGEEDPEWIAWEQKRELREAMKESEAMKGSPKSARSKRL